MLKVGHFFQKTDYRKVEKPTVRNFKCKWGCFSIVWWFFFLTWSGLNTCKWCLQEASRGKNALSRTEAGVHRMKRQKKIPLDRPRRALPWSQGTGRSEELLWVRVWFRSWKDKEILLWEQHLCTREADHTTKGAGRGEKTRGLVEKEETGND